MKSPLFWKLFAAFLLTAVLINQSTWVLYIYATGAGPSWERMESQYVAPVELAAARAAVEEGGLDALDRFRAALPPKHRNDIRVDMTGGTRATEDVRVEPARLPDGRAISLVYPLKGSASEPVGVSDIIVRSLDYLVASLIFGIVFAVCLAWYLTRPIQRVRKGFEALAAGDLGARLAPTIGRRRDEFADLARDFDRMAERLQQLVGMRDQLLHDVSHELRSPLARMNVAIALHRQGKASAGGSIERIEAEAKRLDELVGELLSLARAESDVEEEKRYFDLSGLVEAVVANVQFEARAAHVEIERKGPSVRALIAGSPELLRRALENVLRNAVRVSPRDSVVVVDVQIVDGDSAVEIVVEDRGPGVPADQIERIFEPFVRADAAAPSKGYGLGLTIARRAVAALGGIISARNAAPHGFQVLIELPTAPLALHDE